MKERVNVMDYAEQITKALPRGLLLNTNGEKFNSMVIGWGGLGVMWGVPAFTVYVRENRYTKAQLDRTGEFTVSVPLNGPVPEIVSLCGGQSGRNVDKAARVLGWKAKRNLGDMCRDAWRWEQNRTQTVKRLQKETV